MYIPDKPLDAGRVSIEKARFLNGQKPSPDIVRDFILDSWERSKIYGISQMVPPESPLAGEGEIRRRMQALQPFIDLFESYRRSLEILLKHKSIPVAFIWIDLEGIVVHTDGDSSFYQPGMHVSERDMGTNIAGTSITLNKAMVMVQKEFYQTRFHDSIYAAQPLYDAEKHVAGCCVLEMKTTGYDPNAIRMFLTICDILNQQRIEYSRLKRALDEKATLSAILEHIPSGIIVLNTAEQITFMSQKAKEMFGQTQKPVENRYLQSVIHKGLIPGDLIRLEKEFQYREHFLSYENQSKTFYVSASFLRDVDKRITGLLLAFSPLETLISQRSVHKVSMSHRSSYREIMKDTSLLKIVQNRIQTLARSPWDILITGEKGLLHGDMARAIHVSSPRASGPYVHFDITKHSPFEIRELLWGQFKTDLYKNKGKCLISQTNSGTLVLWNTAAMDEDLQEDFYTLLQKRELPDHTKFNVRFICITKKVAPAPFTEKLTDYFVKGHLSLQPVRSYASDITTLTDNILNELSARHHVPLPIVSPDVRHIFSLYGWPGNLDEMQDVLETALLTHSPEILQENHLPRRMRKLKAPTIYKDLSAQKRIRDITEAMKITHGNCKEAAKHMGIARSTFYEWLTKYNIPH
jgi:PAS domain S-box-containing protein